MVFATKGIPVVRGKIIPLLVVAIALFPRTGQADLADELEDLIGYTIIATRTIVRWYDDSEQEEGGFNGCRHGRVIVFQDGTTLICAEYGYMYAYRPAAVILAKEIQFGGRSYYDIKMVVEDEVYDMRQ